MKVEFAKNKEQKVWFSEWNIYLDGTYSGFIYKTSKRQLEHSLFKIWIRSSQSNRLPKNFF